MRLGEYPNPLWFLQGCARYAPDKHRHHRVTRWNCQRSKGLMDRLDIAKSAHERIMLLRLPQVFYDQLCRGLCLRMASNAEAAAAHLISGDHVKMHRRIDDAAKAEEMLAHLHTLHEATKPPTDGQGQAGSSLLHVPPPSLLRRSS